MTETGRSFRCIFLEDAAQWFHQVFISADGPSDIRIEEARRRVLATFVDPLIAADVEAVVYRICQGLHYMFYDTEAAECIGDTVEILDRFPFAHRSRQIFAADGTRGLWNMARNFARFREVGYDPYADIIARLHAVGKQVYIKTRISDAHVDASRLWFDQAGSRARATDFLLSHPEYMLGYKDDRSRHGGPSLVQDFAREEVRSQRLAELEELARRYDLDGIEINFCRSYHLFKYDETDTGRELLTDFIRRFRGILDREGERKGRRLKCIVRFHIAGDTRTCQDMEYEDGADIIGWMESGLVDMVVPTVPVAAMEGAVYMKKYIEAARGSGCDVFAGTRNPNHDDLSLRPVTREILWAQLRSYARAGADGAYMWWPRIDPRHANWEMLTEFGDPGALTRSDKHYVGSRGLPLALQAGENSVPINVADDVREAAAAGELAEVRLRLRILHLSPEDELGFKINGQPVPPDALLAPVHPSARTIFGRIDMILDGALLPTQDDNLVTVTLAKRGRPIAGGSEDPRRLGELILNNVELTIRYNQVPAMKPSGGVPAPRSGIASVSGDRAE